MEIPILNIYYLLSYAWDRLDEASVLKADIDGNTDLVNLFARVLISGTSFLFRKGLDRNYINKEDVLPGIKGKLILSSSIKKGILPTSKAQCQFDEFSYNVLHNRILKSTFKSLIYTNGLDKKNKDDVKRIYRKFNGVDDIVLNQKIFSKVVLHRNNQFYGFLIDICFLLFENLLPNKKKGSYKFRDFLRDERKMAYVFENFIRNFYKYNLDESYRVGSRNIKWDVDEFKSSTNFLPLMKTDTTIENQNKKLIIDTKYYKEALSENFNKNTFKSKDMYQVYAYLKNIENSSEKDKSCNGLLLYPTSSYSIDKPKIVFDNHTIFFRTINLNQDWKLIHEELIGIKSDCF